MTKPATVGCGPEECSMNNPDQGYPTARSAARDASGQTGAGRVEDIWPSLPYEAWKDTYATLHMWTQIVGKIRLALSPMVNHWWQVTLLVTPRGLTTSPIPFGATTFEIVFDF